MRRACRSSYAKDGRALLLASSICMFACNSQRAGGAAAAVRALDDSTTVAALRTYADIAYAAYGDAVSSLQALLSKVDALRAAPSAKTLEAARQAWLQARRPYAQTEVFRFYDGPIDQVELQVNTWPIDESYVESLPGETPLGIVQDLGRYPQLSAALLAELNGRDGETSISTGFHVLEFLLWGRDDNPDGPGRRSYADFVVADAARQTRESELSQRRGAYLRLATELMLGQLERVRDAWRPDDAHNYRARFLAPPPGRGLYLALKGIAKLSGPELAGERLTVPYETKDQENEHSCFSDSTHEDIIGDALGIQNVCLGRYRRTDGTQLAGVGVCQALAHAAPVLAAQLSAQVAASLQRAREIPAPFERAILGDDRAPGRLAVGRAARALRALAESSERIREALSLVEPQSASVAP